MQILFDRCQRQVFWSLAMLGACLAGSSQAQAQQYFYYPTQPTFSYTQPSYAYGQATGFQYYQPAYGNQYYQYLNPTQYAQIAQPVQPTAVPVQTTTTGQQVIPASYTVPVADTPPAQPATAQPVASEPTSASADPYGFLSWLNSVRASYGLGAVGYDQNLSNWAAQNNNAQMSYGLGHFVMGPARRQNSAMGAGFPGAMWMGSPAHSAALLDPTISWIGIAAAGAYWTFNAY